MGDKSAISWTDATWNPITGCNKVSPGCKHCYAETMALRLQRMGAENYADGFKVTLQPHMLEVPLRWTRPRIVFVNSMSDLFHEAVPDDFIAQVFQVMAFAPRHTFQLLTKRPERMLDWFAWLDEHALCDVVNAPSWPLPNVWLGVSVESAEYVRRIDLLRAAPAVVRFLSLEPLLGPLPALDLRGIHWVIVGGESGTGARPLVVDWLRDIRDQCRRAGVAFFVKQLGSRWAREHSTDRKGTELERWPDDLQIQEMPQPPVPEAL